MLTQFDLAVKSSQTADKKLKTVLESPELRQQDRQDYKRRLDNIHTVTLCEINHFNDTMKSDFKAMQSAYFTAQIAFHERVSLLIITCNAGKIMPRRVKRRYRSQ